MKFFSLFLLIRVCLCSLFDGEPLKGASLKPNQTKEFFSRKRSLSQSEPLHLVFQEVSELGREDQNSPVRKPTFPKRSRFNVESFQPVEEIENDLFKQETQLKTDEILEKIRKFSKDGANRVIHGNTGKQNVTLQHVIEVKSDLLQEQNTQQLSNVLFKGLKTGALDSKLKLQEVKEVKPWRPIDEVRLQEVEELKLQQRTEPGLQQVSELQAKPGLQQVSELQSKPRLQQVSKLQSTPRLQQVSKLQARPGAKKTGLVLQKVHLEGPEQGYNLDLVTSKNVKVVKETLQQVGEIPLQEVKVVNQGRQKGDSLLLPTYHESRHKQTTFSQNRKSADKLQALKNINKSSELPDYNKMSEVYHEKKLRTKMVLPGDRVDRTGVRSSRVQENLQEVRPVYVPAVSVTSLFNDAGLPRKKSTDFDKEFQDNTRVLEKVNSGSESYDNSIEKRKAGTYSVQGDGITVEESGSTEYGQFSSSGSSLAGQDTSGKNTQIIITLNNNPSIQVFREKQTDKSDPKHYPKPPTILTTVRPSYTTTRPGPPSPPAPPPLTSPVSEYTVTNDYEDDEDDDKIIAAVEAEDYYFDSFDNTRQTSSGQLTDSYGVPLSKKTTKRPVDNSIQGSRAGRRRFNQGSRSNQITSDTLQSSFDNAFDPGLVVQELLPPLETPDSNSPQNKLTFTLPKLIPPSSSPSKINPYNSQPLTVTLTTPDPTDASEPFTSFFGSNSIPSPPAPPPSPPPSYYTAPSQSTPEPFQRPIIPSLQSGPSPPSPLPSYYTAPIAPPISPSVQSGPAPPSPPPSYYTAPIAPPISASVQSGASPPSPPSSYYSAPSQQIPPPIAPSTQFGPPPPSQPSTYYSAPISPSVQSGPAPPLPPQTSYYSPQTQQISPSAQSDPSPPSIPPSSYYSTPNQPIAPSPQSSFAPSLQPNPPQQSHTPPQQFAPVGPPKQFYNSPSSDLSAPVDNSYSAPRAPVIQPDETPWQPSKPQDDRPSYKPPQDDTKPSFAPPASNDNSVSSGDIHYHIHVGNTQELKDIQAQFGDSVESNPPAPPPGVRPPPPTRAPAPPLTRAPAPPPIRTRAPPPRPYKIQYIPQTVQILQNPRPQYLSKPVRYLTRPARDQNSDETWKSKLEEMTNLKCVFWCAFQTKGSQPSDHK